MTKSHMPGFPLIHTAYVEMKLFLVISLELQLSVRPGEPHKLIVIHIITKGWVISAQEAHKS